MYEELAAWWPLISAPGEYAEEAAFYSDALRSAARRPVREVLELGSGGGNNASHMKAHFAMTLVDRAPAMLAVSRALNPACVHEEGDMRTVRLDSTFDAVFIHDAVGYLTTEAEVREALDTAFVHTRPGGAILVAPDHLVETYRDATDHGGHDGADGRAARFLEWSWDPDPEDAVYTVDYTFVLREPDGSVRVTHDRHTLGVFPRAFWLAALRDAGFGDVRSVPFDHSELEPGTYEVFLGTRPPAHRS